MNELSPSDRLYELVTELLHDLSFNEVRDTVDEAISDFQAASAKAPSAERPMACNNLLCQLVGGHVSNCARSKAGA